MLGGKSYSDARGLRRRVRKENQMGRTAESILLGSEDFKEINLTKLAPVLGTSTATLCRWRKYGLPENVKVFARACRARNMTAEQIGQMVLTIK